MSATSYSFSFCKTILTNSHKRKNLAPKKGDVIIVPESIDEMSVFVTPTRKKTETPLMQHDKLSNSTISDFGNSFNSDIKSFLKNGKNELAAAGEITFPEFEDGNHSYFQIDKSIEKMKEKSRLNVNTHSNNYKDSEFANNVNFRQPVNNNQYIETVHQINSARNLKAFLGVFPQLFMVGMLPMNAAEDPYVYSDKLFHPVSFLKNQKHTGFSKDKNKLDTPSPTFIEFCEVSVRPSLSKDDLLFGLTIDNKNGLILSDPNITMKFKGIVGDMVSSMFSSIFTKKPVSLPVRIFEPKSTLQRITEYWSFAPLFLPLASSQSNNVEKMKYVICFAIAGLYTSSKQLKPFNPLLGETFEGFFDDNSSVYCEQISHHPTVARFLVKDANKQYSFSGYYDFVSKPKSMGGKLIVAQKGPNRVDFSQGNHIIYNMPKIKMLNCRSEKDRSSIWKSIMVFVDVVNELKAFVRFGSNPKQINHFEGFIINFNYPRKYKFVIEDEIQQAKVFFKDHKLKKLSKISGNWLENCLFDQKEYWNIDKHMPSWVCPSQSILPSDGRFREDLIWLHRSFNAKNDADRKKYEDYSQNWKYLLETIQRNDRELRKNKKK